MRRKTFRMRSTTVSADEHKHVDVTQNIVKFVLKKSKIFTL